MSITSVNAVFLLSVAGVFTAPQKLQGFSADDIFGTDDIQPAETLMGVDGVLSAGFVNVPTIQKVYFQADSASNVIFDTWYAQQKAQQDIFEAQGIIQLPGIGYQWTMTKGFLTGYKPMPDGKKVLQPRTFGITWENSLPALL